MDAKTLPTPVQENESLNVHQVDHEDKIPPEVQTLIDAHEGYRDFSTFFDLMEDGDDSNDNEKFQSPPWDKISERVLHDNKLTSYVLKLADPENHNNPLDIGNSLFTAMSGSSRAPTGIVRAEKQGPYIVLICENQSDFMNLTGLDKGGEATYTKKSYNFQVDENISKQRVPTVIVFDQSRELNSQNIEHEKNHYRIHELLINNDTSEFISSRNSSNALTALEQYKNGEIDKSALENQIREYSSTRTIRAIEEFFAESTSTGKADSRINYDYFDNLLQIPGGVTQEVSELIQKIKDEFNQTVYAIKDKYNRAASEMESFGIHINQAYGFLGMSLLTADQKNISQVLDGFNFIHRIVHKPRFSSFTTRHF